MQPSSTDWDVIIVGGGPAGLSAALVLGRCCRKVLVCDAGTPRNWATKHMHSFLSRDGICPKEFREIVTKELSQYENIQLVTARIEDAERDASGFRVSLPGGAFTSARKLLIATGLLDDVPRIEGMLNLYGKSVFPCPYCDGWEIRHSPVAVYGSGRTGLEMARAMTAWTRDIALCTDGPSGLGKAATTSLKLNGILLCEKRIARLEGENGQLHAVVFADGERLTRRALFFDTSSHSQSSLAKRLGCTFTKEGGVRCGNYEATSVPGLFVAGNITKDVQLAVVAAAEGAKAAFGINRALTREDFEYRATGEFRVDHAGPSDPRSSAASAA